MPQRFLDTNILLRYFTRDDEDQGRQALAILARVERGDQGVVISPMVIFEAVVTLPSYYRVRRSRIRELVEAIISLTVVRLQRKKLQYRAFDLYVDQNISVADAYDAAYMEGRRMSEIHSWDTDLHRLDVIALSPPHCTPVCCLLSCSLPLGNDCLGSTYELR